MKRVISILSLLLWSLSLFGQTKEQIEIYFDQGSYAVDRALRANENSITEFVNSMKLLERDTTSVIQVIEVNSYTSPEGGRTLNSRLSQNRSAAIRKFIESECVISPDLIVDRSHGIWWEELRVLVENSDMQYKTEVLNILDNTPEEIWGKAKSTDKWDSLLDSRLKQLMDLKGGVPYKYISQEFFPHLRRSTIRTAFYTNEPTPQEVIVYEAEPSIVGELLFVDSTKTIAVESIYTLLPEPELTPEPEIELEIKPLFAIKTNLLFDIATLVNLELEVPIGNRWSVAAEWIFPWWSTCGNSSNEWQSGGETSERNTLQLLNGNIEAKYWLGDRSTQATMTGWHLGFYAGGGLYDLEYHAEGYQGEFFIAAGLSAGYAHTINKSGNLRMEYSAGIGYLQTEYRYYQEHWGIDNTWHTIRQNSGKYTWIGPTRARVSLVWMLNRNAK